MVRPTKLNNLLEEEDSLINNVTLTGRMTKDIELKYTQAGKAVASFSLAVNRNFTNAQGNREADFINCVSWGKTAETMANYLKKGSLVGVVGRIQTRNYENQQGQRVYITEVLVTELTFLESNSNQSRQVDPFAGNGSSVNISDDDLPF